MTSARGAATRSNQSATRYELGEPFASGGMGVIRRGFDRWASREIAHKRLRVDREEQRPRISALFQREYDTLARLKHPNIVEVYDFGFDEQGAYYVMEWLSGDDLSKRAPLPYRDACGVLRDVGSALALVHTRRFVHRDVSPNNVRLTRSGVAKLIDFGALTSFGRPGEIAGTPAFIAPECLRDQEIDQRTDIYSLGALAYWALSGRPAVRAQSIGQLLEAIEQPVAPLAHQVPDVPEALHELVHAMLSQDPALRPGTASEVIDRLTAIGELAPEREERKVAYSYLKHPPLQGRGEALGELQHALDAVMEGRGSVLAIEGGVGLGRSAILEQLAIEGQLRGATVLRAEGNAETSAHGLARRLIQLGLRIYPDLEGSDAFVRRMLENGEMARSAMEPLERATQTALRIRKWLLSLCERGPLVLAVDDADMADEESLGLLASLMQEDERGRLPLLLAIALRSDEAERVPLTRLLLGARRLRLTNLEQHEVVALLTGVFGDVPNARRTASWLYGETGGNPAQSIDLLRLLIQQGAVRYQRGTFALPHDIDPDVARDRRADALLTRVAGLSPDARALLELLCLHQGSLSHPQLSDAAALTPREVSLALEQLIERGVAYAPGEAVSLRGESLRAVCARTLDDARQQAIHLALARAIELYPETPLASALSVAWHLFRAAEEADAAGRMMRLLEHHGYDVSSSASSVPLLESALHYYQRLPDCEPQCADLLSALSISGYYGNLDAQRKYLRPALAALGRQCGFDIASRLTPYLGVQLALLIGCTIALLLPPVLRRRFGLHDIQRRMSDLYAVALCGSAVAATTSDDDSMDAIRQALRPALGFPRWSVPGLAREFVMANDDMSSLRTQRAAVIYERLLAGTSEPRFLLQERLRYELRLGCMNGRGHCYVGRADGVALEMADELERGSAFFAVHAEVIRVLSHALVGQHDLSEHHRQRAELLALRGGASWAAASTLSARLMEVAIAYGDGSMLMRVEAELARLVTFVPPLSRRLVLARARLLLMRGEARQAAEMLEHALADTAAKAALLDSLRLTYSEALCQLGAFERAREQAMQVLHSTDPEQRKFAWIMRGPFLQLVRAEVGLGNHDQARAIMLEQLENAVPRNNPLELGIVHRELATVALAARDVSAFDRHLALMTAQFRATQHPNLARQSELLLARAVSAGIKESPTGTFVASGELALDSATIVEPRSSRRILRDENDAKE